MRPKGISVDRYKELAAQGLTASAAARLLGVSKTTVQGMARRHSIAFVRGKTGGKRDKKE
jgi:excisionase family DNA binding protein